MGRCTLSYSPTGRYLATGGPNGTIKVWDAASLEFLIKIEDPSGTWIRSIAFSPDGRKVA